MLAKRREDGSINLFRLAIPIVGGIVEVVDPQIIGAQRDRLGFLKRNQWESAAGLADHSKLFTCFPKGSLWNTSSAGLGHSQTVGVDRQPRKSPTKKSPAFHLDLPR